MKNIIKSILLSITLSFLFIFVGTFKIDAASSTIEANIDLKSSYSYSFSSSKIYDRYDIQYILYNAYQDKYYEYSTYKTIDNDNFRNDTINQTIYFSNLKETNNSYGMTQNTLTINITMTKRYSCGFHNMESNCLVDSYSSTSTLNISTPTNLSPENNYETYDSSIQLSASDEYGIFAYYYRTNSQSSFLQSDDGIITLEENTTYHWYATNIWGVDSPIYSFTRLETPYVDKIAPTLISPDNNSILDVRNVTLIANDDVEVYGYYYRSENISEYQYSATGILENLENNTTYYWYATDTSNNRSQTFKFSIYYEVLDTEKPVLVNPENNAKLHNNSVNLIATDNIDIKGYYYKSENETAYTFSSTGKLTNLIPNVRYYWYAIDTSYNESETFSFIYEYIEIDTTNPTLISPVNMAIINTSSITLVATDDKGLKGYYYRSENDLEFSFSSNGTISGLIDGTTYYWYAKDTSDNVSNIYSFTYIDNTYVITYPTLISPLNGSEVNNPVRLEASDIHGISGYYYRASSAGEYSFTNNGYLGYLIENETYYWYAVDNDGYESEVYSFKVILVDREKPVLVSPKNGEIILTENVTLIATDNEEVTSYTYCSSLQTSPTTVSSNVLKNLIINETYYWYATDANGNSSETYSFTYYGLDKVKPTLVSPSNNETIKTLPVTLYATDNTKLTGYYYKEEGMENFIYTETGELEDLKDETTYLWYAIDIANNTSDTYSFNVYLEDVTAPVIISPANNTILTENHVTLKAEDNRGIKAYYYKEEAATVYTFTETGELTNLKDNVLYYWYAVDTSSNKSETYTFKYLSPDTTNPILVSPANNSTVTTSNLSLVANDNREVAGYYYKEENESNWKFSIIGEIEKLKDYTYYSWYAVDTSGNKSETYTFYVDIIDTQSPELIFPYYGYEFNTTTVTLEATDDKGISRYLYKKVDSLSWLSSTSATLTLENGYSYYWYVIDVSGNQTGLYMFTISLDDNQKPVNISPSNNSTVNKNYVELKATDNIGVTSYSIGKVGENAVVVDSNWAHSLSNNTKYYWYATDNRGNNSEYFYFTTSFTETNSIVNVYPSIGERVNKYSFNLQASAPSGISMYYYQQNDGRTVWEQTENGFVEKLDYDLEYLWYAIDNNGNQSEIFTFIYDFKDALDDSITIITPEDETYINRNFVTIQATSISGIQYYKYKLNDEPSYSSCIGNDGNCNIRFLNNNDIITFTVLNSNLTNGEYRRVYVDLEYPIAGSIDSTGVNEITVNITPGSDNFSAKYYYRVNYQTWIEYNSNVTLKYNIRGSYVIETKAIDKAGNETVNSQVYSVGEVLTAPSITIDSGVVDTWTNENITVTFTPVNNHTNYYCIDDNCTILTEKTTITFSTDLNASLYTKTTDDNTYYFNSAPVYIMLDKTAPVFGKVFYPKERYNFNTSMDYIVVDTETLIEASNLYTIYYKFLGIDKDWFEYTNGRVPLYSYYLSKSGTYYVDLKIVDIAGNESEIYSVEILTDVQGPSININSKPTLYYTLNESTSSYEWKIKFEDLVDDYGYIYHISFNMWDQNDYDSNSESTIAVNEYTDPSTTYFEYDITNIENGNWYYLIYVCDNYINCTYSPLYSFTKTDNGPLIGGGSTTMSLKASNFAPYSVLSGLALLFVATKKRFLI